MISKCVSLITAMFLVFSSCVALAQNPTPPTTEARPAVQNPPAAQPSAAAPTQESKSAGTDTAFRGVKVADAKGKQTDASLIFSDNNKNVVVRVADRDFLTIPYGQIDKFSYEYSKKHRITQGAIVMVASLGAGAIVMLTKSKSHWLYIDFHEQTNPKSVVLRMDKKEYKQILEAVKTHTGKEVEFLGDAGKSKDKKDKDKEKDKK